MLTRRILRVALFPPRSLLRILCATLFLGVSIGGAQAQAYPSRLIKFVVDVGLEPKVNVVANARCLGRLSSTFQHHFEPS